MGVLDLAAVAAGTALGALGEEIVISPPPGVQGNPVSVAGIFTPETAIDTLTGAPVVASTAYVLIPKEKWAAVTEEMAETGPPKESLARIRKKNWLLRAVIVEGDFWRLEIVEFKGVVG